MEPEIQDKEWAAFYLGQFMFAIMGPALAMDEEPIQDKAKRDWQTASEHAVAAAKQLNINLDTEELLKKKGSKAKHVAVGKLLSRITYQVEERHGKPAADLLRLGNIAAACMAYDINLNESSPIQLGFIEISNGLAIPEKISSGFLRDPFLNFETFAAISVQHAKDLVSQQPQGLIEDVIEVKPGVFGINIDVKKLIRHIFRWIKG